MSYPKIIIYDTPVELVHVALLGLQAAINYGYKGRKAYTFQFYGRFKVHVRKNLTGWSLKVTEIEKRVV